jgi:hypothetical protein
MNIIVLVLKEKYFFPRHDVVQHFKKFVNKLLIWYHGHINKFLTLRQRQTGPLEKIKP